MADQDTTTASGRRAEQLATDCLRARGYELTQRNYRCKLGEIDIVARDGDVLCFIEVRSRRSASRGHPLETVDRRKQARIIRAAEHYLATQQAGDCAVRFDVVAILFEPELDVQLVQGAFEAQWY